MGTTVDEGVTVAEGDAVSVGNGSVALGEPSLGSGLASVGVGVGVGSDVGVAEVGCLVGDFVGSLEDVRLPVPVGEAVVWVAVALGVAVAEELVGERLGDWLAP